MSHPKVDEAKEKMHKAVVHLQEEFGAVRTGRATPALVEKLRVDYYGSEVPLQQLAGFSVPEPRVLVDLSVRQGRDQERSRRRSSRATSASTRRTTARSSASRSPSSPPTAARTS